MINISEDFLEEEVRNEYTVSKEMKRVWAIQLDLLSKVLEVCKKYNLKIFADSGTLLGAIRHGGYIPWDDDIDLAMLRTDYIKLCQIADKEFEEPYFFQTEKTDPTSSRGHIQIRNSNTTGILLCEKEYKYKFNQGIFIDILALDNITENKKEREKFLKKLSLKKKIALLYRNILISNVTSKGIKGIIKKYMRIFVLPSYKIFKSNFLFSNFERYAQKYNKKNEKYLSEMILNQKRTHLYEKDWYSDFVMKKFEMIEIPVPKDYEKVLDEMYGEWKIFKKGTCWHGGIIFDTEKSYQEYLKSEDGTN